MRNKLKQLFTFKPNDRQWSDVNKHWGPFTWAYSQPVGHYKSYGASLRTSGEDSSRESSYLLFEFGTKRLIVELGGLLKRYQAKVIPGWDSETIKRLGRDYYFQYTARVYGFTIAEGNLHLRYGASTYDSLTDKSKCYFIPWLQDRYIGTRFFDVNGNLQYFYVERLVERSVRFERRQELQDATDKVIFEVEDNDGTRVMVTTYITEMEHRWGEGYFKWLSWFRKPMLTKRLELDFASEIGSQKGSWKGGLMGCSADMLPGELHESALKRWIEKEDAGKGHRSVHLKILRKVDDMNVNVALDPNGARSSEDIGSGHGLRHQDAVE